MAKTILGDNAVNTYGQLPNIDEEARHFELLKPDLTIGRLKDYEGKRVILNIFPSVDTKVCGQSVKTFSAQVQKLKNTKVVNISRDLPFAQKRFCDQHNIDNVDNLSDFRERNFGKDYGVELIDSNFQDLLARAVIVIDEKGKVLHTELVDDISKEPNYEEVIRVLS